MLIWRCSPVTYNVPWGSYIASENHTLIYMYATPWSHQPLCLSFFPVCDLCFLGGDHYSTGENFILGDFREENWDLSCFTNRRENSLKVKAVKNEKNDLVYRSWDEDLERRKDGINTSWGLFFNLPCLSQWLKGDQMRWPMRKGLCQCVVNYYCYQVWAQSCGVEMGEVERQDSYICLEGISQKDKMNNKVLKREGW